MKRIRYYVYFLLVTSLAIQYSCSSEKNSNQQVSIPVVDFAQFEPLLYKQNDTVYVINFWATWCAPCVKEIPHFEKLNQEFADSNVKVILVNLDFPNHFEGRLVPFITENKIKSEVIMLDDPNSNYWINQVSQQWSGSIPATLIYNKNKREFFEKEFTYEELLDALNTFN